MNRTLNHVLHTATGLRHLSLGQANQDTVKTFENERLFAMAAVDSASGITEKGAAEAAAAITVDACIRFAGNEKIWEMKKGQLSEELIHILDDGYLSSPFSYEQLCATLVLLVINKVSGEFLLLSVGDCAATVFNRGLQPSIMIDPVNFVSKRHTLFANSSAAGKLMRIERGSLEDNEITGILLTTDGAEALLEQDMEDTVRRIAALTVLAPEKARAELEGCVAELSKRTSDDITAALVMLTDIDEVRTLAEQETGLSPETPEDTAPPADKPPAAMPAPRADTRTLTGFLAEPRAAEELILAGLVPREAELLTILYPYLRDGMIVYDGHRLMAVKGG